MFEKGNITTVCLWISMGCLFNLSALGTGISPEELEKSFKCKQLEPDIATAQQNCLSDWNERTKRRFGPTTQEYTQEIKACRNVAIRKYGCEFILK